MTKPKQGIKPPHPAQRPWRVLERCYLDRSPWHTVRTDRVQLPTGVVVPDWYVFEFLDWVEILAITKEGKFVIISQYRHGLGETRYELPAGSCDEGETPLESAKRELFEETGYGGGRWELLMTKSPNPSNHNNHAHAFLALDVKQIDVPHNEESEDIRIHLLSREEVLALLLDDEIQQSMHAAALWKYMYLTEER